MSFKILTKNFSVQEEEFIYDVIVDILEKNPVASDLMKMVKDNQSETRINVFRYK